MSCWQERVCIARARAIIYAEGVAGVIYSLRDGPQPLHVYGLPQSISPAFSSRKHTRRETT